MTRKPTFTTGLPLLLSAILLMAACSESTEQMADTDNTHTNDSAETAATVALHAMQEKLQDLQTQAQGLKDTNAIKRLQRSFGYYMSEGMWDEVADLFTDDATWEFARDGVYRGKQRIRAYLAAMHGGQQGLQQGQLNEYLQLMPVITLADDGMTAKARWRSIMMLGELDGEGYWGEGPYENTYVKQDGVWKLSSLHWYQTILVPYKGAWGHSEDVNQGIWVSDTLPPDAPATTDYGSWPTTFLPPFSFENPVGRYQPETDPQAQSGGQQ